MVYVYVWLGRAFCLPQIRPSTWNQDGALDRPIDRGIIQDWDSMQNVQYPPHPSPSMYSSTSLLEALLTGVPIAPGRTDLAPHNF